MPEAGAGQRVLITAGASGIGRAMADAFAEAGARVWVADIDPAGLEACPPDWRRTVLDVADEPAVAALAGQLAADWGGLDVLCSNAGIAGPTAPIEEQPLEGWTACLAVNLQGGFLMAKHFAPMMKAAGHGAMIFTSSNAGLSGFPNRAPYAAAKWGLHGLMKTVAMELGPHGIRANAICPGPVEGPRIEAVLAREAEAKGITLDAMRKARAGGSSLRTLIEARDIAAMAVFLASEGARHVSGQIIAVDGHTETLDPRV